MGRSAERGRATGAERPSRRELVQEQQEQVRARYTAYRARQWWKSHPEEWAELKAYLDAHPEVLMELLMPADAEYAAETAERFQAFRDSYEWPAASVPIALATLVASSEVAAGRREGGEAAPIERTYCCGDCGELWVGCSHSCPFCDSDNVCPLDDDADPGP